MCIQYIVYIFAHDKSLEQTQKKNKTKKKNAFIPTVRTISLLKPVYMGPNTNTYS